MHSQNFEFLRPKFPELSSVAAFAELYLHSDPASAAVKLRSFAELLTANLYRHYRFPRPPENDLNSLLIAPDFHRAIPPGVQNALHSLRKDGNQAAHGGPISSRQALESLIHAFNLSHWWSVVDSGKQPSEKPPFQVPPQSTSIPDRAAESQLAQTTAALTQLQSQYDQLAQSAAQLDSFRAQTQPVADLLQLSEAETRQRLIDRDLVRAGWNVGPNGAPTPEVTQEHPLPTGERADYVLWDTNGKPLAVVEAKRTSRDLEAGRHQASSYADALEAQHGQRPIIFLANGHDLEIWEPGTPPRPIYGFYSRDSLQYSVYQRRARLPLAPITVDRAITDRLYQIEAIRRVSERLTAGHRKSLVVQATGTGKTRVAISLTDVLMRAGWVKRVLFLCDRTELRRQATKSFNQFLDEPIIVLDTATHLDRSRRIYLATYPALDSFYRTFDPGFFHLLIADESHRSIYNHYRDLFRWFDCPQVGLTATPVEFISRNSFQLFGCANQDPTFYYSLDTAVAEKHLVPHEVITHTTQFLREGIRYAQLSEAQRREVEESGDDPATLDYDPETVDKQIHNQDTNRLILRNLMEQGIRDPTGQRLGKTIIFARGHRHALLLHQLFNQLYPQYGGTFCAVIDNQIDRREQLIADFKNKPDPVVAISVDMLDTGIDVPEIVNLVFAKPVRSRVKFWQMIGRGTRLCPEIGKTKFRIFDHWGNFDYFGEEHEEAQPQQPKALLQRLFEARIDLAQTALDQANPEAFALAQSLIAQQMATLPPEAISVREKWRELQTASHPDALARFSAATVESLRRDIAPLMQWIPIGAVPGASQAAYNLDLLLTHTETELLRNSLRVADLQAALVDRLSQLKMNLNPVRERIAAIQQARSPEFWRSVTVPELETLRTELRGIMHYRQWDPGEGEPRITDITEDLTALITAVHPGLSNANSMALYRERVSAALLQLFAHDPTLQKIRRGEPVTPQDLDALASLVLTQNPNVDLHTLQEFYPATQTLETLIRDIIGMDPEAVNARFVTFAASYPLTATQTQFLSMLKQEITKHGRISVDRLYDTPFTAVHAEGLEGVFQEHQITALLTILESFDPLSHRPMAGAAK